MAITIDNPLEPLAVERSSARLWTLITVSLATFMTYLDNNIINVAIPTIQRDLHLTESGIEWVVSSYILVFAALLLAGGRLADVFGLRRLFMVGLGLFTVSSLLAGLSGSVDLLITFRALQGLGAALLTPTTLAIISAVYRDPKEQAGAVATWSAVGALALAFGPLLGGFLSEDLSWHWIFFINVPVGIAILALSLRTVPELGARARRRIDWPGVVSSTLALGGLTYALIQGPQVGWSSGSVLASFVLAAVAALTFVLVERGQADPMVDLTLLRSRTFSGGVVALMLWAFGLFGIYFFTSIYLQNVLHFSAIKAGLAFVPMAVLMAAGAGVSDRVATAVGAYWSVGVAMLLMGGGIASVGLLGTGAKFWELMPSFAVIGIGGGLTIPLTATILGVLPADRSGVASALFNASREVAGLLGITVIGVVLSARRTTELRLGRGPVTAYLDGFHLAVVVAGVLVASGGAVAWLALRSTRNVETETGHLDVLVNNAGISVVADVDGAMALDVFNTNAVGVIRVTQAALPLLHKSDNPVVVNVSSALGSFWAVTNPERRQFHFPSTVYGASKAAVSMLTVQYAKAVPEIKFNAVQPGFTATDLTPFSGAGQPVEDGAAVIVRMATIGKDGPTGTFEENEGKLAW